MSPIPLNPTITQSRENAHRLQEAAAKKDKPASVHMSTVFDNKNPADSYPEGTEINFGETAPLDMGGIPDLFDPAAVTGDGI